CAEVASVQQIWPAANWHEREMWELYGINVKNHDNLTRFLLPDDWDQGHPLRKDWNAPDFIRMPEL
ncbi:MAG: NADH-quinone oxidoreductase subunit C, partial [candidate division Zixibacteria bacterium]|nr:NADH-quinone oxidoreductase subunit C [candidate division Zixibacteria bacterium]